MGITVIYCLLVILSYASSMHAVIQKYKNSTSGATSIEYGLIAAVIAIALILGLGPLKEAIYGEESGFDCINAFLNNGNRGDVYLVNDGAGACARFEDGSG